MANKYSHALVMSQFHDSGLLSPGSETPPKSKSSRISQSWTISEVIPPSKPLRSVSPARYAPSQRRAPLEADTTLSPRRASMDVSRHSVSLGRSDSIITQVYAPRSASPDHEKRRARRHRSKRRLAEHTASTVMYDDPWDLLSPSYEVASPKCTRCECGGIVHDARLQSSYFPDTRPIQKPLPGLPVEKRKNSVEHKQHTTIRERSSTPRFELAAEPSPRLLPTEATIKPIRRMAPPRTPTTETPTSSRSRSSSSKPKPEPIATVPSTEESAKRKSEATSKSSSEAATNSQRLSSQTTPPTSPSVESIFSVPSRFSQSYATNDDLHKIPIYDRDIVTLPWNDPQMGPTLSCTSPPPGLIYPEQPPSPGSSIDDATPPPISRVRRQPSKPVIKSKRTTFKTPHTTRPRALSSTTTSSLPSPPLPFIPPLTINKAFQPYTEPSPQPIKIPQPYIHYKAPRPYLDVRTHVTAIPYQDTVAGPEPVPTDERVAPPPPLSTGLIRVNKEKEVERWRFRSLKGMLGFGGGGGGGMGKSGNGGMGTGRRGVGTGFMRGLVSSG